MIHLSRWSEDLIIYSSQQFSFVKLSVGRYKLESS
jgi:argininosuccinate lyase